MIAASFGLQLSFAANADGFDSYTSPEGVKYSVPSDWTPMTLNQLRKYTEIVPEIEKVDEVVPGALAAGQNTNRIFFVNQYDGNGRQIGQVGMSIDPVPATERVTQREFKNDMADPEIYQEVENMFVNQLGPQIALGMNRMSHMNAAEFLHFGVYQYGDWQCFGLLFDTNMTNGEEPYHMSIQCPDGEMYLRFTAFVDKQHQDEIGNELGEMVAAIDTSGASWWGASVK